MINQERPKASFSRQSGSRKAEVGGGGRGRHLATKRLLKEKEELESSPLEGCVAGPWEGNLLRWSAVINGPVGTLYEGGTFFIDFDFTHDYPFVMPNVTFLTRIYHCNIDSRGKIHGRGLTARDWNPCMTVADILNLIISLLHACDSEADGLAPSMVQEFLQDREAYEITAREWTARYAQ